MLTLVISGGQTGGDRAGLIAARSAGLPTGGTMPRLFLVKSTDGRSHVSDPAVAAEFGLTECPEPAGDPPPRTDRQRWALWVADAYRTRTAYNARQGDGTIWFGADDSRGFGATASACRKAGKPLLVVKADVIRPSDVVRWLEKERIACLNVAGNRASTAPDIEARVVRFLGFVFRLLATSAVSPTAGCGEDQP